jgi:ABC-type lipoprotein export system ATPase subunit
MDGVVRDQGQPARARADGSIHCEGLVKIFKVADLEVVALQGLDLDVDGGELLAIVGASGSGKSTLLSILGGLDVPSAGRVRVAGHDLLAMDADERTAYRRTVIGFVWQQTGRNLLPYLDARRNVELPMAVTGIGATARHARAMELLDLVGLADRAGNRPGELSGGEQQRVAIATALANEPDVLLADEPTGELDSATAEEVFAVFHAANRDLGITTVILTHDPLVSEQVDRTVQIRDGRTATETVRREEVDAAGRRRLVAEEYAVLDRVGRLQLPHHMVAELGLRRRVRLEQEPDHVGVWRDTSHETARDDEQESR